MKLKLSTASCHLLLAFLLSVHLAAEAAPTHYGDKPLPNPPTNPPTDKPLPQAPGGQQVPPSNPALEGPVQGQATQPVQQGAGNKGKGKVVGPSNWQPPEEWGQPEALKDQRVRQGQDRKQQAQERKQEAQRQKDAKERVNHLEINQFRTTIGSNGRPPPDPKPEEPSKFLNKLGFGKSGKKEHQQQSPPTAAAPAGGIGWRTSVHVTSDDRSRIESDLASNSARARGAATPFGEPPAEPDTGNKDPKAGFFSSLSRKKGAKAQQQIQQGNAAPSSAGPADASAQGKGSRSVFSFGRKSGNKAKQQLQQQQQQDPLPQQQQQQQQQGHGRVQSQDSINSATIGVGYSTDTGKPTGKRRKQLPSISETGTQQQSGEAAFGHTQPSSSNTGLRSNAAAAAQARESSDWSIRNRLGGQGSRNPADWDAEVGSAVVRSSNPSSSDISLASGSAPPSVRNRPVTPAHVGAPSLPVTPQTNRSDRNTRTWLQLDSPPSGRSSQA